MIKMLICIPVVNNVDVTRECLDSVVKLPVHILLANNGATKDIKHLFDWYQGEHPDKITVIEEPVNIGVNPIWNKFLKYFIAHSEYTHIGILNSDVIVHQDFLNVIEPIMEPDNTIPLPTEVDKEKIFVPLDDTRCENNITVNGGVAGTFIILNRFQAELVTPIPESIKIWFGDNWIFDICRGVGFKTKIIEKFMTFHHGSQTVQTVKGVHEQIEKDKENWALLAPLLERKIETLKTSINV